MRPTHIVYYYQSTAADMICNRNNDWGRMKPKYWDIGRGNRLFFINPDCLYWRWYDERVWTHCPELMIYEWEGGRVIFNPITKLIGFLYNV